MKRITRFAACLTVAAAMVAPALASAPACLNTQDIRNTKVINPKTILFHMRDGKVWQSSLVAACPGLMFNGFKYVVHADEICGGSQAIRVLESHEVCLLGRFTAVDGHG